MLCIIMFICTTIWNFAVYCYYWKQREDVFDSKKFAQLDTGNGDNRVVAAAADAALRRSSSNDD